MDKQQLELAFGGSVELRPALRGKRGAGCARWWFAQMHQLVDRAFDWRSAPPARPEQTHLALAPERA